MRIALCNEVLRELEFSRQCAVAKALGYDGLELAPFTFGEGADRFTAILRALRETSYPGWLGIEPFIYEPDGPTSAARSIGYVRGVLEAIATA